MEIVRRVKARKKFRDTNCKTHSWAGATDDPWINLLGATVGQAVDDLYLSRDSDGSEQAEGALKFLIEMEEATSASKMLVKCVIEKKEAQCRKHPQSKNPV